MIADNNLDYFSVKDLNEMEVGWNYSFNGNLIVYIDRAEGANPAHPVVYKIYNDTTDSICSSIVDVYKEQNSTDTNIMRTVLSNIISNYPAQSYGLVLWSHGTGWYPKGTKVQYTENSANRMKTPKPLTKSFGIDMSDELNINDLKESLPVHFDFILFDACYMGSIEVLYELREKADYIISSPTEVLSYGYPYDLIVPYFFENSTNYRGIATEFINSYINLEGVFQTASVSVTKTAGLVELAEIVNKIMQDTLNLQYVSSNKIQQFELTKNGYFFDFGNFISESTTLSQNKEKLEIALGNTILFKASTSKIFDELQVKKYSGLSVFLPDSTNKEYYDFYKQLDWFKDSSSNIYFNKYSFDKLF
ncbi:MAG: hypothetical protein BGO29_05995 [Bacteroidales bacterium 36-12]|nr:MAG: hypothetical protein BGO29_05995 [Bacteroidales bacterium 36-12]